IRSRFPLVLFDLDGTLVDSFKDICAGIGEACTAIGVQADDRILKLATRGVSLEEVYQEAEPDGARFKQFADGYRAHYLPGCVTTTVPYPGVVETLTAIRELGPKLAVATTERTDTALRVLEGTGLRGFIDVVAGSDGIAH